MQPHLKWTVWLQKLVLPSSEPQCEQVAQSLDKADAPSFILSEINRVLRFPCNREATREGNSTFVLISCKLCVVDL